MKNLFKKLLAPRKGERASASLYQHPLPLFSASHNLALFWSAKAGCTFAVKWFFHHTGELDKALSYSPWIHEYREQIYYDQPGYIPQLAKIIENNTAVVKMVRDPYARAVSSYLMAVRAGYENEGLSKLLGRIVDEKNGFSFEEFLDYLGSLDLRNCNIHHRLQVHPAEEAGVIRPQYLIRLESSYQDLAKCEKALGLAPAPLDSFRKSGHHTFRRQWPEYWGHVRMFRHLGSKMLPNTKNFYTSQSAKRVKELYAPDFQHYYNHLNGNNLNDDSLEHHPSDELLLKLVEQFPAAGPVQVVGTPVGYFSDSWCSSQVSFSVLALDDISRVDFLLRLPNQLMEKNLVEIVCGHHNCVGEISSVGDACLPLQVELKKGNQYLITLKSEKSINLHTAGKSSDNRDLAYYLIQAEFQTRG